MSNVQRNSSGEGNFSCGGRASQNFLSIAWLGASILNLAWIVFVALSIKKKDQSSEYKPDIYQFQKLYT
jgi:hypothetical protein